MDFIKYKLNVIKHRGDPKEAILQSGHRVEKQEYLFFTLPDKGDLKGEQKTMLLAAEYHMEHFLYVDPVYEEGFSEDNPNSSGRWFAMCTCGSAAVMIGAAEAFKIGMGIIKAPQIAVCFFYAKELESKGIMHAKHQTSYVNVRK